jgi:hypothetical protein
VVETIKNTSAVSTTNRFNGVQLTDGKRGTNTGQFVAAVIDKLRRKASGRPNLLEVLQEAVQEQLASS